jgi:stress-induced morphogen
MKIDFGSHIHHYFGRQSILQLEFQPTFVDVKDVSGGCGAMFNITVESEKFKVS